MYIYIYIDEGSLLPKYRDLLHPTILSYIYIHIYICIYIYIYICLHIYIYICVCVCVHFVAVNIGCVLTCLLDLSRIVRRWKK